MFLPTRCGEGSSRRKILNTCRRNHYYEIPLDVPPNVTPTPLAVSSKNIYT
jgi:hypothetical protein